MTKALEIVELSETGQVQLSLFTGGDRRAAPPAAFQGPLAESDHQEIGWYFQDFLADPFGPSKARAEAVETGLRNLGRQLFETVFQGNDEARSYYASAGDEGLSGYQLVIISRSPAFLGLPWELLNEPDTGYLAPRLGSLVRRTSSEDLPLFESQLTTEQFNVLLVSPFPDQGQGFLDSTGTDAPAGTGSLSFEALNALESLDVEVELDCLRPPTFAALAAHLGQNPARYHLVHLDALACADPGELIFESENGSAEPVDASRLGELLAKASIPMVLLNGNSGSSAAAQHVWTSTAVKLSEAGVPFVVSMPFPLPGPARILFTQRLYQQIVKGGDLPATVAVTRQALMDDPQRPSPVGNLVFWDWTTPTIYQSRTFELPLIEVKKPDPLTPPGQPAQTGTPDHLPQGGPYGLVGRRAELRHLERLFHQDPVVLMSGSTGVGKSELALGLAGWFQKTGARPGGVFYTTFEVGAGLERVVHEIGTSVAGLSFADLSAQRQRQWVVEYLQEHPSLLVWDGLQNAGGFAGEENPGLLEEAEREALAGFLAEAVETGQTWALLIGRGPEADWLTVAHTGFHLPGLGPRDRLELACRIQEATGLLDSTSGERAAHHLGSDYLELLDMAGGHPLALQIAIPLLKELPASVLMGELRQRLQQADSAPEVPGRDPILTTLMDYSFSRMSRRSRVHLPFLSLFQRRIMMDILTHITQERTYRTVMGEDLGWGACRTLLRSARDAGFLEGVTPSVYQIHPTYPWFYGQRLSRQVPASGIRQLEQEFVRVYADTADYFMETLYENQDSGTLAVLAEEGNLTQALGLALEDRQWDTAQLLVQPLAQVYRMQKRYPELRRLRRQLLQTVTPEGRGAAEAEPKGAIDLWLYLLGTEAAEAADLLDFQYAEELNHQLLDYLISTAGGENDPRTAAVYHQLGIIEQHRWNLDGAEDLFQRSLAIIEKGEDQAAVADDYHCLGQIRQSQRRYSEAKEFFSNALDIHQRLQDEEEMVKDYRALGLAAQYKFEYEEAESWYQRARAILEENRDEETVILVFHELGTVYHARYLFEEAESWYQQALSLSDRLGKEDQMAVEFHHLGLLAQARGVFYEDAENWFELAREKREKLGDRRGAGDECRQLAVLFHEQQRLDEAEQWYRRAQELFEEIRDVERTARTYGQLGKVAEDRGDLAGALEWAARTYGLAVDHGLRVLPQVKAHLAALRDGYGEENFTTWWQGFTGGDPPEDLDQEDDQ